MAIAKINDINMYYEIHGKGQPLVLIAGYTCDHTFWQSMLDKLSQYFQIIIFDNRGIGSTSDTNKPFTIDTMADDTINLLKHLNIANPIVIGQSMGGAIAQSMAVKFPQEINKLVIINSVQKFNKISLMALESLLNIRKADINIDLLTEATLPWIFSAEYLTTEKNIEALKNFAKSNPNLQSIYDQQRQLAALKAFDSRPWNININKPSLVIGATNDIISTIPECQELANNINAKFLQISGGHASPLEQPEILCQNILDFLFHNCLYRKQSCV